MTAGSRNTIDAARLGGALLLWLLLWCAAPVLACGSDTDCPVGQRLYRIALPDGYDGKSPVGAVIWAHGHRGTAAGVMRNGSLRRMLSDAGLALIALDSGPAGWDIPHAPGRPDSTGAAEFAYVDAVLSDATRRFAIDRNRIVASGFSAGAMLVWNLACARPDSFAGFVPVSGTFWKGPPATCATPITSIVHIHGNADTTVPLNGRAIGNTVQGAVADALAMYADFGAFKPAPASRTGALACDNRRNADGAILVFCRFSGGHSFRTEYLAYGLERLRGAGAL